MDKFSRIYVAGHNGMVGSAIVRKLQGLGYENLLLKSRQELDLLDGRAVEEFFQTERPSHVFLAAAKVGGILANSEKPVEFLSDNLMISLNVINASYEANVSSLLYLGSSCIYPKMAPQPIAENSLLSGPLEVTNEAYAIAKIAGLKLCEFYKRQYGKNFRSAMPTNLYGAYDNFDLQTSHVLPALIRKFHEAKISGSEMVEVWGSGSPLREFLHVDDLADACLFLMVDGGDWDLVNVGTGQDISIRDLAVLIQDIVGFDGEIVFDRSKPDGTPRKLLDVSRLTDLGWQATIGLEDGVRSVYEWYLEQKND